MSSPSRLPPGASLNRKRQIDDRKDPQRIFLALVNGVAGGAEDLPDLYSETTWVTHPFDPLKRPGLSGRESLRAHFSGGDRNPVVALKPANIRVHETTDPEVIVAEFDYAGHVIATGTPVSYPCIFVMRIRDGLIVESRDYIDHLGSAEARGRLEGLLQQIRAVRLEGE